MRQSRLLCMALFLCVGLTLLWGQKKPAHESPRPQGAVKVGMEEQHKAHVAGSLMSFSPMGAMNLSVRFIIPTAPSIPTTRTIG